MLYRTSILGAYSAMLENIGSLTLYAVHGATGTSYVLMRGQIPYDYKHYCSRKIAAMVARRTV